MKHHDDFSRDKHLHIFDGIIMALASEMASTSSVYLIKRHGGDF